LQQIEPPPSAGYDFYYLSDGDFDTVPRDNMEILLLDPEARILLAKDKRQASAIH
jgi:hypothetical protein